MPRHFITDHKVNGLNERLEIEILDERGPGGAHHAYNIAGYQNDEPANRWPGGVRRPFTACQIRFQKGPIETIESLNGITNEALLAVLIDRLRGFQSGQFACRENAIALTHLEDALHWLHHRTRQRMQRGVEGTNAP